MQIGEIVHLGDNMPWRIRKPYTDWRGHVPTADYNGYAKIDSIQGSVIGVLPLYGNPDGKAWIAHPVYYDVSGSEWRCLETIEKVDS